MADSSISDSLRVGLSFLSNSQKICLCVGTGESKAADEEATKPAALRRPQHGYRWSRRGPDGPDHGRIALN